MFLNVNFQAPTVQSRLELLLLGPAVLKMQLSVNMILCKVCVYNKCSAFQIINDPSTTAVAVKKGICHLAVNHYITKVALKEDRKGFLAVTASSRPDLRLA